MNLARVKGSVWMNRQHPSYDGKKLLVVQPETPEGAPKGPEVLAVDDVDAGVGDRVLLMEEGSGARQILGDRNAPIRSIVVGVVDGLEVNPMRALVPILTALFLAGCCCIPGT